MVNKITNHCTECGKEVLHLEYNKDKDGFCDVCGKLNTFKKD